MLSYPSSMLLRSYSRLQDTHNTESCPTAVQISAGLDVLFHSMESYTAIPYVLFLRINFSLIRLWQIYWAHSPAFQSHLTPCVSRKQPSCWHLLALGTPNHRHLPPPDSKEPRWCRSTQADAVSSSLPSEAWAHIIQRLASSFAGIGFGNAGVHLCHGMSYPVSKKYSLIWSAFINHFAFHRFLDWTRRAPNTSILDTWLTFLSFHMVSGSWPSLFSCCFSLIECLSN